MKYFCVEEVLDEAVLADHGLTTRRDRELRTVIIDGQGVSHLMERSSLRPLLRRPNDAEGRIAVTENEVGAWRLFYVRLSREELAGERRRDTLAYIDYGARTDFRASAGSRREGGVVAKRPQVEARGAQWWSLPSIDESAGRLAWVKGRGERHYVSMLPAGILVPDNFLISAPPAEVTHPHVLAAAANSSWTHLMVEIFGRRAGGDGVLHTYIGDLDQLPILDVRALTASEQDDLVAAFQPLVGRQVLPITDELQQPDRQQFDRTVLRLLFGKADVESDHRIVERALRDLALERRERAASGREQERKAQRRASFNPEPFAARLLADLGQPPRILERVRPDDGALDLTIVELPDHPPAETVGRSQQLFTATEVSINGQPFLNAPSEAHAEAVIAALRREPTLTGPITLPTSTTETLELVESWQRELVEWRTRVKERLRQMVRHPQRRKAVLSAVASQANCALDLVASPA